MVRAAFLTVQVSNVETVLVSNVEQTSTVVAGLNLIVETTRVAVNDGLSKIARGHLFSHLVDNANHGPVGHVGILMNNSIYVRFRIVNAFSLA
jgi:hypothetical protein